MAKNYIIQFGQSFYPALAPTFTAFQVVPGGGATTAPGVTAVPGATGMYYFSYEPAGSIAFILDGATTGLGNARYITGALDPVQAVDERITEMGTTLVAIGNSLSAMGTSLSAMGGSFGFGASIFALLGSTASSFGSTATDPATVFGFLKRLQEFNEGNSVFYKTSGLWDVYARGNAVGASTMLVEKSLVDSGSVVTKA